MVVLFALAAAHAGARCDRCDIRIERSDSGYTFDVRFASSLPADTLLQLINDSAVISRLMAFTDEIEIVRGDSGGYTLHSRFSRLGFHGRSTFRRRLFAAQDSIAIEMVSIEHDVPFIPKLRRADSYYKITDNGPSRIVHFHQTVRFDRGVGGFYMAVVRWQLRRFARTLAEEIVAPRERAGRARRK
jgi:hypothetical protein